MDLGLSGKACIVTGATSGIGAATARLLEAEGADVLGVSRSGEFAADVTDPEAPGRIVAECERRFGRVDVLVNNAGIFIPHPIDDTSYEQWQRAWEQTLAVNLVGAANATWCAVRHMGRGGRIVNVSSRGAFRGEPLQPAYGVSKVGLVALGQSLARALGPRGISVTTVAPGFADTDMAAAALAGDGIERRSAESPLGRIARVEEIAAAVVYLASPLAEIATGTVLDLNGASHLRM
jgi:3-oxoacyl-[acyl-carrier protein] reductase